jgi:hypothetical protein
MNMMTEEAIRAFVTARLLSRISGAGARRDEALRAVLGVAAPGLDDAALERLTAATPELPVTLYEKWVGMFLDRLLTTVPQDQLRDLCANTPESNASLQLVYAMFMESARMEAVVEDDLKLWLQDAPSADEAGGRQ